jgi:2,4-dienoyl-CoA reductase-like NADH-dependent reductase (Old Yellow Enzyme family)
VIAGKRTSTPLGSQRCDLELRNRIVMAPLARTPASQPGNVPNEPMREYYQQRGSGPCNVCWQWIVVALRDQ